MHLLNLTLQAPSNITQAVVGSFSGAKGQEILAIRGGTKLEILKLNPGSGQLDTICSTEAFGTVRNVTGFRLAGMSKDYILASSDSGRLSIIEFVVAPTPHFESLYQEVYGKSGSRRIVPGQYLAVDPKGRSCLVGASKLVYVLNRNSEGKLFPSSPLEAHRNHNLVTHIVGVDQGYDNPLYAALEMDYSESDEDPTGEAFENYLTFYELDLGLNHVVRKWSEPTDRRANLLVQVPGGQNANSDRFDGPSGVLVCTENHIIWKHMDVEAHRIPIPRRRNPLAQRGEKSRGLIIVAAVMHKIKGAFFFLLQSEDGDLYKVWIEHEGEDVRALKIKYFDTVPVANSLCILKSGYLFVASEFSDQNLYQFQALGDDDGEQEWSSTDYPDNGNVEGPLPFAFFSPRPLQNLLQVDTLSSLDPITDASVVNLLGPGSDTPQIYAACGRGPRSTFRTLKHGLDVSVLVSSPLPGVPTNVWTLKLTDEDEYDSYIVLSFPNGTLVLSIGATIEEVNDTGFLSSGPTLAVQQLGDSGLLQVHPYGLRHIRGADRVDEWPAPPGQTIVAATTNKRQVVIALSTAELVYFELDPEGSLSEYQDKKGLPGNATCLSIAEVPEGRRRTPFLAVGCDNQTVSVISLEPDSTLTTLSLQALTAPPSSICLAEIFDTSIDKNRATMFLNIGLSNGVLLRTVVDPVDGSLSDTRLRFLGAKPPKLVRSTIHGQPSVLAFSSRTWLLYTYQDMLQTQPLIYDTLEYAWNLSAAMCPDGLIGISGNTLRIFTIPKLGEKLKQDVLPLSYTPRKFISHPYNAVFYMVESDHRTYAPSTVDRIVQEKQASGSRVDMSALTLPPNEFGRPRAGAGHWASLLRVLDPLTNESLATFDLDEDEAAFSIAIAYFERGGGEPFLVAGTGVKTTLAPRGCKEGYLRVYAIKEQGRVLEFMHKTKTDDVPLCLAAFQGFLLAGVGKSLRLYEMGKKALLRKCENNSFPTGVATINVQGARIIVGDMQESTFYCVYRSVPTRQLLVFADDTQPRWLTCVTEVDYETIVCGDKFGNIFLNRLDSGVSEKVDDDPTGATILHEKSFLMGAAHKTELLAHYNVGSVVTSITKIPLVAGGRDVLVYTTISGSVGALIPFVSMDDVEFMTTLEMHMRSQNVSLVGRDHLAYRGYYVPVKGVIDGDLCENFNLLPYGKQQAIAADLDERSVGDVLKKLEQMRTSSAF
uniref:Pre-mRNA-splicing factor RSE1 n=1 Tax=Kwoniella dejecticola CBS 10117 TaxID=1296121 RepID=A0A1A6AEB7_9TREE|nr:pre-mRNA-splicing factor RSE1 [Kwoniella dejecticola CBS 10117]OBR88368.1 pre-mRNA-splicing factor RSE1 [Kwoniella dejecticola CBS 10117]